jgi:16S rRNA processing protein RimM
MEREKFLIAQIGKTVGLKGDLKLHLHTDFPQQFTGGVSLESSRGLLTVDRYDSIRNLIRFKGYETPESARMLTNAWIYSDEEQTRKSCPLKKGEHYWFEIIGASVMEHDEVLGKVSEIQRMHDVDYLLIETDGVLFEQGFPATFLLPYIPRYIVKTDTGNRIIETRDARDILEAS